MKRRLLAVSGLALAVCLLLPAAPAGAHPLGNFTTNVYAGIIVQPEAILLDYVVDLAEIPAFRERRTIDTDADESVDESESLAYRDATCAALADNVIVRADGEPVPMVSDDLHALAFPQGAAGLSTLRLECRLIGDVAVNDEMKVSVEDRNYPETLGWREMSAVGDGVTLNDVSVPEESVTRRLLSYPEEALPSDVTTASFTAAPGGERLATLPMPGDEVASGDEAAVGGPDGGLLASLVGREQITPLLLATMLLVALGVGALHALGPGHGKTLIGAYLVGEGGSVRNAVGVGAAVSVMHTASVLTLGLLVLSAERLFAPERVYPVLGLASGLIALGLGTTLLVSRIHAATHVDAPADPNHEHGHSHPHPHDRSGHDHTALQGSPLSRRGLLALAFSGGILPSPSALVVLLASVSLGRTVLGLVLIAAFSLGLAGALIGVGVVAVSARGVAERRFTARAARVLPVASAAAIAAMGLFLTVRGALQL